MSRTCKRCSVALELLRITDLRSRFHVTGEIWFIATGARVIAAATFAPKISFPTKATNSNGGVSVFGQLVGTSAPIGKSGSASGVKIQVPAHWILMAGSGDALPICF